MKLILIFVASLFVLSCTNPNNESTLYGKWESEYSYPLDKKGLLKEKWMLELNKDSTFKKIGTVSIDGANPIDYHGYGTWEVAGDYYIENWEYCSLSEIVLPISRRTFEIKAMEENTLILNWKEAGNDVLMTWKRSNSSMLPKDDNTLAQNNNEDQEHHSNDQANLEEETNRKNNKQKESPKTQEEEHPTRSFGEKKSDPIKKETKASNNALFDITDKPQNNNNGKYGSPSAEHDASLANGSVSINKNSGQGKIGSRLLIKKCEDYKQNDVYWQEKGKAIILICINAKGYVVSAEINKKKSTITKTKLIDLAIACAKEYRFGKKPGTPNSCGEITINFGLH